MDLTRIVLLAQAAVYVVTGLWSLVSRSTFERVTGPKHDYWLVRMVGLLAFVNGAVLAAAVGETRIPLPIWMLAIGSALSFAIIDIVYATSKRISRVYLLDAVFEIALVVGLLVGLTTSRSGG